MRWEDVRREPFRLLFPLGMALGCLGVGHWLAYAAGWIPSYSGFYHASIQVGTFLAAFVVGFLLTALPRFAATEPATSRELIAILLLILAQPVLLSLGLWIASEACFAGVLLTLAIFARRRFAKRQGIMEPPTEFVWIPIAILHGLIGSLLLIAGQLPAPEAWTATHASALALGRPMVQQGFILSIVAGVGGFLAPRLLGRAMPLVTPAGSSPERSRRLRLRRIRLHLAAGALLFASFVIEGVGLTRLAYFVRALVITAELAWTAQFYRPPRVRDLYVRFIWISLWGIVLGLWGVVLAPPLRVHMLHVVFLGGLNTMMLGVGTMVVLSHAGESERLRAPLAPLKLAGVGLAFALAARLIADRIPSHFFAWLGLAALGWIGSSLVWLVFALPFVAQRPSPEAFERAHEEAKRRLQQT